MSIYKNERLNEAFREELRVWQIEREYNELDRGRPNWIKEPLIDYESFKKKREKEIYLHQTKGDYLEDFFVNELDKNTSLENEFILNNFVFDSNNGLTQLDVLFLTPNAIFIIEVKDWKGRYWLDRCNVLNKYNYQQHKWYVKEDNPIFQIERQERNFLNYIKRYYNENFNLYKFIYLNADEFYDDNSSYSYIYNDFELLINEIVHLSNKNTSHVIPMPLYYKIINEFINKRTL